MVAIAFAPDLQGLLEAAAPVAFAPNTQRNSVKWYISFAAPMNLMDARQSVIAGPLNIDPVASNPNLLVLRAVAPNGMNFKIEIPSVNSLTPSAIGIGIRQIGRLYAGSPGELEFLSSLVR